MLPPMTTQPRVVLTSADGSGRRWLSWMPRDCDSWTTTPSPRLSSRYAPTAVATPEVPDDHAVLRLARAAHEGPGGLCPQGDRPRSVRRRPGLRPGHRVCCREPLPRPAQGVRDL